LGGTRQGALHRNGFAGIHPDAAGWFSERRGALGVVLGTSQYIVRLVKNGETFARRVQVVSRPLIDMTGCRESDLALRLEMAADLAMQGFLVPFNRQ
jgi:hypothetical protein